jgi:hypothetical protein
VHREILKMGIRVDSQGYVHFHELLYRTMRRLYGVHELLNELDMQLFELITQHKVQQKTMQEIYSENRMLLGFKRRSSRVNVSPRKLDLVREEPEAPEKANPFLMGMVAKLAFKAWLNEAKGEAQPTE